MGPSCFGTGRTVRRGRGNHVGSVAGRFLIRRWRAGRNKDGGVGVSHVVELVLKDLSEVVGKGWTVAAKAKQVLLETLVEAVEDCVGGSQCEERWEDENRLGISMGVFIWLVVQL